MVEGAVIAEKKVVLSNAVLPDGEVKRIFIGGVGGGVTAIDMEKTFSPLGRVHAVEFVRTNGRNFAFMDFEPSSVRSLAKLFSAYNGCTWKGGKLKLEMAKEHYLARLKREWVKDAKLASVPPPTEENLEFVRSHCSNQENLQIRIFFPKLRKVKPLPFKGSGKHKYSFQRIEVPPLPIHFCDCEEHSKALETTYQKYLSPLSTVMHEKEQNIRSNVINKLMGGDNDEIPSDRNMLFASDPKTLSPYNEDIHSKETEVSDIDDDNLVMNIGAGAGDDLLMQLKGGMTPSTCQVAFGNHLIRSCRISEWCLIGYLLGSIPLLSGADPDSACADPDSACCRDRLLPSILGSAACSATSPVSDSACCLRFLVRLPVRLPLPFPIPPADAEPDAAC